MNRMSGRRAGEHRNQPRIWGLQPLAWGRL